MACPYGVLRTWLAPSDRVSVTPSMQCSPPKCTLQLVTTVPSLVVLLFCRAVKWQHSTEEKIGLQGSPVPPALGSSRGPLRLGERFSGAPPAHAPARHLDNPVVAHPTLITASKAKARQGKESNPQPRQLLRIHVHCSHCIGIL